jgi:hypothetical protein
MQMATILIISVVLACLPLLVDAFFLAFTLPRKLQAVNQDVKRLAPPKLEPSESLAAAVSAPVLESEIKYLADKYSASNFTAGPVAGAMEVRLCKGY